MEMSATFRREIGALSDVFQLVERFFEDGCINPEMRFPIDLAIEEIFTNLVRHNPSQSPIGILLSLTNDELKMALTDFDSTPFDLTSEAPDVDINQPLEERKPGGLGVFLVKKIMDRVEYEHQSQSRMSTITLYKRVG